MIMHVYTMNILSQQDDNTYEIQIEDDTRRTKLIFSTKTRTIIYLNDDLITDFLKKNEYQFRKILHNKRENTFYPGFILKFALRDNKDMYAFNNKDTILYIDKKNEKYDIDVVNNDKTPMWKLYTDGSCPDNLGYGGYSALIEDLKGNYTLHTGKLKIQSSNLLELVAVIKGLEALHELGIKDVRLITDSQYVRKGITEWLPNWYLNNWLTVNGEKAKNIEYWQRLDSILDNKYLELQWVKAHSGHFENTICDLYAKDIVKKS